MQRSAQGFFLRANWVLILFAVKRALIGRGGVPYLVTHDGRTIRYPDPDIKVNDTVKYDLKENKVRLTT